MFAPGPPLNIVWIAAGLDLAPERVESRSCEENEDSFSIRIRPVLSPYTRDYPEIIPSFSCIL